MVEEWMTFHPEGTMSTKIQNFFKKIMSLGWVEENHKLLV